MGLIAGRKNSSGAGLKVHGLVISFNIFCGIGRPLGKVDSHGSWRLGVAGAGDEEYG